MWTRISSMSSCGERSTGATPRNSSTRSRSTRSTKPASRAISPSRSQLRVREKLFLPAAFVVFTASGFAGLIYESVWSHYLKLFLGHAAHAQTLVLVIFMGGMALGAWLASRVSPRWKDLLLVYALIEALIGFGSLAFHDV